MLGGGGRRGCPVGQFGQIVEKVGPGQRVNGHGVLVPLPAVHGGEGDRGPDGRAESRIAAQDMVDREDLPDHGPTAPGSPPATPHTLGVPGRGRLQGHVVAVLGLVIEEHALGARGVPGRGRLHGLGRCQVPGGCDGPVHRVPHERGDAREKPYVGHLGQYPGDGFLAHFMRRGPGVLLDGPVRLQVPFDRGGDLLEQLPRPGVRQIAQGGGSLLVPRAQGVPVGDGRHVRGSRRVAPTAGAGGDGPQLTTGAVGVRRVRVDRAVVQGHDRP